MNLSPVVRYQVPVALWVMTIFTLSSIPSLPVVKFPFSPDKIGHAGIYFVLCLLWRRALFHQMRFPRMRERALGMAFILTAVLGGLDELYQMTVPGRFSSIYDFMADVTGGLLYVVWFIGRTRMGRENAGDKS